MVKAHWLEILQHRKLTKINSMYKQLVAETMKLYRWVESPGSQRPLQNFQIGILGTVWNARVGMGDLSVQGSVPASAVSSLTALRLFRHEWRYPPLKFMNSITPERVDFTSRRHANLRRYTWNFIISGAAETCEFLPGTSLARLYFLRRRGEEMSLRERWEQWRAAQRRCSDSTWNKDKGWRNESRQFPQLAKRMERRQRQLVCFFAPSLKEFCSIYFLPVALFGENLKML